MHGWNKRLSSLQIPDRVMEDEIPRNTMRVEASVRDED